MKKTISKYVIFLTLCFSIYCFSYINSLETGVQSEVSVQELVVNQEDQNTDRAFLPDLALVEKIASVIKRVSKIF